MKYSYNWLKWYVPEAPSPDKLADVFTYHLAEVETFEKKEDGDAIFDIKILPNRAHDLLSHIGLAKEVASLLDIPYEDPAVKYKTPQSSPTDLKIEVKTDNCRRYSGRIIRNVKIGPSPEWVVKHLEAIGQRSINNMVDAANLVMFNCGQPTHVFDLGKVKEKLIIRQAEPEEHLVTLDNKECKLTARDMIIADNEKALAIAGVKGGKAAEVDANTTDIILEVANFDPASVRKTAQAQSIFTDAKKRFENDLSPELAEYAMSELSALVFEMCPEAKFEDVVDIYPQKTAPRKLVFRVEKISKILGIPVTSEEIKDIFRRYNLKYSENGNTFEIEVPTMRLDLEIEEDMAEEIGRVLGYDRLKDKIPKVDFKPQQNQTYAQMVWARNKLTELGYGEVMTSSFKEKGEVSVLASASDKNFLRSNLSDGLGESLKLNQSNAALLGLNSIKIFEIGTVFKSSGEEIHVAWRDRKEIKEMTLREFCKDANLSDLPEVTQGLHSSFKPWSPYPFIARDIALWVPEKVKSEEVAEVIIRSMGGMVVRGPELFDEFKKEGKVSYAFRLVFQAYDRTLTDTEVNDILSQITGSLTQNPDWQIR